MAYQGRLFTLIIALQLLLGPVHSALYGERCTLLFTSCEYKGGGCDITKDKCGCAVDTNVYNKKTGECQIKTPLGAECSKTENCTDEGAVCLNGVCTCDEGLYISHYEWLPDAKCLTKGSIGDPCMTPSICDYENGACINSVCDCANGFTINDENSSCIPGAKPSPAGDAANCKDPAGKPCCAEGMYLNGDECRNSDETAVIGLKAFPGTTTLALFWYPPYEADIVQCYQVSWKSYNGSDTDFKTVPSNSFDGLVNITGLVPGRVYDIQVGSKLKCDDEKATYEKSIYAITIPEVPGPILPESDLDPASGFITIRWKAPSVGEYTDFRYKMLSLTRSYGAFYSYRQKFSDTYSMHSTSKYGLEMNITLQACTTFLELTRCSDNFKATVTTKVLAPSPARDVVCTSKGPGQVEVQWAQPRYPHGEIENVEVYLVPVVDALVTWMDNSSGAALDKVRSVAVSSATDGKFYVTFKKLPRDQLFTAFVYAQNKQFRSELPGSQGNREFGERYYDNYKYFDVDETTPLSDVLNYFMIHLETVFRSVDSRFLPPVCAPVIAKKKKPLKKPRYLSVKATAEGTLLLSWRPPKKGLLAGYVLKVQTRKGACLMQYDFRCTKGCLTELFEHPKYKPMDKVDVINKFPQPDDTCEHHTTINMTRDDLYPISHYNISGLPKKDKLLIKMTSIGYFRDGQSVFKKVKKPKSVNDECDACKSPRDLVQLERTACNVTGALFFRKGKLETDKSYPENELRARTKRLLYRSRDRKSRPKKSDFLLPGSKTKKCACSLLKEPPKFKLALLKTDAGGKYYNVDAIYSMEERELTDLVEKLKKTCWRR